MHITFSILKFYFNCRAIICYGSILFSNASMHEMEANTFTAAVSSLLSRSSKCSSSTAYFISCTLTVSRNALLVLLWADGIWHPNSLQGTAPGPGVEFPNEPTHKYLHRTECISGHDSK